MISVPVLSNRSAIIHNNGWEIRFTASARASAVRVVSGRRGLGRRRDQPSAANAIR